MFLKDKVIVGSGKPSGSVRKEKIAVSGVIQKKRAKPTTQPSPTPEHPKLQDVKDSANAK